jgi:hypothetical protein
LEQIKEKKIKACRSDKEKSNGKYIIFKNITKKEQLKLAKLAQ